MILSWVLEKWHTLFNLLFHLHSWDKKISFLLACPAAKLKASIFFVQNFVRVSLLMIRTSAGFWCCCCNPQIPIIACPRMERKPSRHSWCSLLAVLLFFSRTIHFFAIHRPFSSFPLPCPAPLTPLHGITASWGKAPKCFLQRRS